MADEDQVRVLAEQVAELQRRIRNLQDVHAIRTLHYKYGYYIDKCLYDDTVELFAEKRTGAWTGWIGYTLSRTKRRFQEIDGGRAFSPKRSPN